MPQKALPILLLLILVFSPGLYGQETESAVPELEAMHEVIYPIWHTAYPEKDIAALKGFVPEIDRLAAGVLAARLPGILRDKEARWQAALAEFRETVDAYRRAAGGGDDSGLLAAAENLHGAYEMLVRTIRPVLAEVDEFHKILYVVYHKDLPDKKYAVIETASRELVVRAEAVLKAKLPPRLAGKSGAFQTASEDLLEAARELEEVCRKGDQPAVEGAVLDLHAKYQSLEKVFD
ncbi:MAG: PIN domain-containing protein [Candidatus Aminicenantales bacterium]